jgi:hypothetical protein
MVFMEEISRLRPDFYSLMGWFFGSRQVAKEVGTFMTMQTSDGLPHLKMAESLALPHLEVVLCLTVMSYQASVTLACFVEF